MSIQEKLNEALAASPAYIPGKDSAAVNVTMNGYDAADLTAELIAEYGSASFREVPDLGEIIAGAAISLYGVNPYVYIHVDPEQPRGTFRIEGAK